MSVLAVAFDVETLEQALELDRGLGRHAGSGRCA